MLAIVKFSKSMTQTVRHLLPSTVKNATYISRDVATRYFWFLKNETKVIEVSTKHAKT